MKESVMLSVCLENITRTFGINMFFFKNKKIVLNCFTTRQDVFEYSKIEYAKNFYPEWWKKIPKSSSVNTERSKELKLNHFISQPTMKACSGLIECYQQGFMIPLWSDLSIFISSKSNDYWEYQFSDKQSVMQTHASEQRGEFANEKDYIHLKLITPWMFRCDEDVKWIFMQPTWNNVQPDQITILPGIVEYKYQHGGNINVLIKKDLQNKTVLLEHGQPMAHIIPISERKIDLRLHKVSKEEYDDIAKRNSSISFLNKYNKIKKIKKCPVGFNN